MRGDRGGYGSEKILRVGVLALPNHFLIFAAAAAADKGTLGATGHECKGPRQEARGLSLLGLLQSTIVQPHAHSTLTQNTQQPADSTTQKKTLRYI